MKTNFLKTTTYFYLFFCISFIPFPFYIFSFQPKISQFLFSDLINEILKGWGIIIKNPEISSDSLSLYVLVILLFFGSLFISFIFLFFEKWKSKQEKIFKFFQLFFTCYLSMQLLKYGCDKLFKAQFYLPEPNTLYTPLGQISKDLLFWSTMGSSHSYNVFMGFLEIIPAAFLLFKKTRTLGLLIAIPVLMNIVAINLSFDISVKIYSIFLLCLSLFLCLPYLKSCYDFFIKEKAVVLKNTSTFNFKNPVIKRGLKTLVIGLIVIEALFPYFSNWNFNDDKKARPYLHGAYEVQAVFNETQEISKEEIPIKRIFIHRRGYLIFQNEKDEMQDYKLKVDRIQKHFIITDYQQKQRILNYFYSEKERILELQYFKENKSYQLILSTLDWEKLPLIQDDFHWYIEESPN